MSLFAAKLKSVQMRQAAGVKVTLKDTKNSGKNGGVERHRKYGERRDEEDLLYDEE
jgi:hypothetical protein